MWVLIVGLVCRHTLCFRPSKHIILVAVTFILFASRLCDNLGCSLSSGGYYCMIATMFWFAASLGAINMYYYHRESVLLDLTLQTNVEAPTEPPLTE